MNQSPSHELPEALRQEIAALPEYKMGVHRVTVELNDGRVFTDVDVAWECEIVRVAGSSEIPFDTAQVQGYGTRRDHAPPTADAGRAFVPRRQHRRLRVSQT